MAMFRSLSASISAVLLLSACAVGPDFKRPDEPAASRYTRETPAETADPAQRPVYGQTPPNDWWSLFQSTELNALMEQAKQANYTLAAARSTLAQANELLAA